MAGGDQPPKDQEKGTWTYHPSEGIEGADHQETAPKDGRAIEWTASEFIAHEKSPMWYVAAGAIGLGLATLIYLATRDIISVIAVVILAGVFITAGARKPRIVAYRVDRGGVSVGKQFHPYGKFKSFAFVDEGAFASITLLPMKRFSLPLSLYFSPEDEDKILDVLSSHLPLEPGQLDGFERFMRNIHF